MIFQLLLQVETPTELEVLFARKLYESFQLNLQEFVVDEDEELVLNGSNS